MKLDRPRSISAGRSKKKHAGREVSPDGVIPQSSNLPERNIFRVTAQSIKAGIAGPAAPVFPFPLTQISFVILSYAVNSQAQQTAKGKAARTEKMNWQIPYMGKPPGMCPAAFCMLT